MTKGLAWTIAICAVFVTLVFGGVVIYGLLTGESTSERVAANSEALMRIQQERKDRTAANADQDLRQCEIDNRQDSDLSGLVERRLAQLGEVPSVDRKFFESVARHGKRPRNCKALPSQQPLQNIPIPAPTTTP